MVACFAAGIAGAQGKRNSLSQATQQSASIESSLPMNGNTVSITVTLPMDGGDVTLTAYSGVSGMLIHEILLDNAPTLPLCTPVAGSDPLACTHSDFRIVETFIGESPFRPGLDPRIIASNDVLGVRPFVSLQNGLFTYNALPIPPLSTLALVMDTENGVNDVVVTVTFAISGDFVSAFATGP
jgi:hypothetical protein